MTRTSSVRAALLLSAALPLLTGCPKPPAPTGPAPTPTTAGSPALRFRDTLADSGIVFAWTPPGKRPLNILQTIGNGCAFLDYDNDGNLDILLVGPRPALYRGDGTGKFTDARSLLKGLHGYFLGCATGDWDNDGFVDLYLSGYREGRLLHNDAGKGFTDVTAASGLKPQPWGTSATWTDLDRDGKLDLFICNYVDFGPTTEPQLCYFPAVDDKNKKLLSSCGPRYYKPIKATLWRNAGGGRFEDKTVPWGAIHHTGKGLGAAAVDFDDSGQDGIAVANDETAGNLFRNTGGGKLADIAVEAGVAYDRDNSVHAGMGIDWGDCDNDGKLDLVVTTFRNEAKSLYHNDGERLFTDVSYPSGVGRSAFTYVSFGVKFLDADNDGWLDIILASGHVQDNIEKLEDTTYRQPTVLLRNKGMQNHQALFDDVTKDSGVAQTGSIVGRGLAVGDYDNDGKLDVLVVDSEGKPLLLHNESPGGGHWLRVALEGRKANRSAHGALLTLTLPDGRTLLRHCQSDGSYMSASDARVHFGLGAAAKAGKLTVHWPGGATQTFENIAADRDIRLTEGEATVR